MHEPQVHPGWGSLSTGHLMTPAGRGSRDHRVAQPPAPQNPQAGSSSSWAWGWPGLCRDSEQLGTYLSAPRMEGVSEGKFPGWGLGNPQFRARAFAVWLSTITFPNRGQADPKASAAPGVPSGFGLLLTCQARAVERGRPSPGPQQPPAHTDC